MKKILLLTMLCVFLLSGCKSNVKSERELQNELQTYLDCSTELQVNVESLEILKRQTNLDKKNDIVFVEAMVKNEKIEAVLSYKMYYNLYDKGWILDSVTKYENGVWNFKPLQGPGQEIIDSVSANNYTFEKREEQLENGISTLFFTREIEKKYVTYTNVIIQDYKFNSELGLWERVWDKNRTYEENRDYKWDIVGEWHPVADYEGDYIPSVCQGIVMNIVEVIDNKAHIIVSKNGSVCFDENVEIIDSADFVVETSNNYWDDIRIGINNEFVGQLDRYWGTRNTSFERK